MHFWTQLFSLKCLIEWKENVKVFRRLNFLFSFVLLKGLGWTFSTQMKGNREYCFTIKNDLFF